MRAPITFSLRAILAIMFIVALASIAIGQESRVWAVAFLNLVFLHLMIALLGALFRRGPVRAWWVGFFVGGSGYLLLLRFGHPSFFFLNILLGQRYPHRFNNQGESIFIGGQPELGESIFIGKQLFEPGLVSGHFLLALTIAVFGGYVACYFHSGNDSNE